MWLLLLLSLPLFRAFRCLICLLPWPSNWSPCLHYLTSFCFSQSKTNYHPERISWLHHQSEVDKIKSKHLSFVGSNFVFQSHFLLLPHHVCFAYRTLNFLLSLEYARNFHKALANTNGKGNLCKLEKGALFSSSFIAV